MTIAKNTVMSVGMALPWCAVVVQYHPSMGVRTYDAARTSHWILPHTITTVLSKQLKVVPRPVFF